MNLTVFIMVGAPGSGKTTWGKEFALQTPNTVRVCPDEFRAKFGLGEDDQTVSAQAFAATREALEVFLTGGKNVIVDATSMHIKARKDFIKIAKKHNANVHAYVFERDKETLLERNRLRGESGGRNVPENIIDIMLENYQPPTLVEVDYITYIK